MRGIRKPSRRRTRRTSRRWINYSRTIGSFCRWRLESTVFSQNTFRVLHGVINTQLLQVAAYRFLRASTLLGSGEIDLKLKSRTLIDRQSFSGKSNKLMRVLGWTHLPCSLSLPRLDAWPESSSLASIQLPGFREVAPCGLIMRQQ